MSRRHLLAAAVSVVGLLSFAGSPADARQGPDGHGASSPTVTVINTTALSGVGSGSAIGPDGAVYVTNSMQGTLVRIDPRTGAERVVGSGLPTAVEEFGFGAFDVAFRDGKAYVLVTLAGSDVGKDAVMGLYKQNRDGTFSVFADIGSWAQAHPPVDPDWFLSQGVQYSMDVWRDGFVVTDAHHAKVYKIDSRGNVSELVAFPDTDVVPLGLEVADGRLLLTTAGPIPHVPGTSKINTVSRNGTVTEIAGWGPDYTGNVGLLLDVEAGSRGDLYGLLQGHWDLEPIDFNEGFPAAPNTGEIVKVVNGEFRTVVSGINDPTSFELVGHTGFVVTIDGTVLRIDGL